MKKVIILGGGYGGIKTLETFGSENIDVTLIDKNLYHYLQTESYNFLSFNISLNDITLPLESITKGVNKKFNFIQDEALNIKNNTLICKNNTYSFDYLIIATGSKTLIPKVFNKENFYEVKELKNAIKLKHTFENILHKHLVSKTLSNIVVIGGGSSGVEIAAEMKNYMNESPLYKDIKVTLIAEEFLTEIDEKSREIAYENLRKLGIKIIIDRVEKVENDILYTKNKEIKYSFCVLATGIKASDFVENLDFKKENGFLVVDEYLRVRENIFAIGDCALLKDKNNNPLPPTAQTAEQSGIIAAKNILRLIHNKPLLKADLKIYGLAIALGGKFAIAITPFFKIDNILGYLGKKAIEKYYKLNLKLKME